MNNETSNTPEAAPVKTAKQLQLEQHEVPEVLDFLKENAIAIVVGVLIAAVAFVGYSAWKNSRAAKVDTASALLANSSTVPQFQEIIANYGETPAAPLAQLSLASAYYDQAQYELARDGFQQFIAANPEHTMAAVAELGVAQSLEALAQYDAALAGYDAFLVKHADNYLAASATFGKARVLEAQQKYAEAKTLYEEFIAANPESRWLGRAETGLEFVKKQERAAQTP